MHRPRHWKMESSSPSSANNNSHQLSIFQRFNHRQEGFRTQIRLLQNFCLILLLLVASGSIQLVQSQQQSRFFQRAKCPGGFPMDGDNLCSFWAAIGECPRNPRFMTVRCMASCNVCPVQRAAAQSTQLGAFAPQQSAAVTQQQSQNSAIVVQQLQPSSGRFFQPSPFQSVSGGGFECSGRIQTVEIATRIVPTRDQFENRGFRIGCLGINQENICSQNVCYHQRYRTFDGSCNNFQSSLKGAAFMPFARLQPANYEDGVARMVGNTKPMPNPRSVTHLLLSSSFVVLTKFNGLLMQFGQFLSHDITRNTVTNFCRCNVAHEECANMPVPMHDTRLRKPGQPNFCIPLTRSSVLCGTGTGRQGPGRTPRTPVNENSAWIDASQVYGNEPVSARQMRVGALLRTLPLQNPPFSAIPPPDSADKSNLMTGDNRGNLFVGLMALHTVFVRLHNKIATNLMRLNPHWDQERIYQESRKLNGAILQMITYQEFLPSLLGNRLTRHMPPYSGYKPETEPAIAVEFAAGAYRLHGLIREFYQLADPNFRKIGDVRFVSNAGSVELILRTGTDQLIRGLMMISSKKPQRLAPAVTEELFDISDMGSLNIQRGRDQGLQSYNVYRPLCGMKPLTSFQDWPEVNEPEARNRVASLYASVNDIDLYVGGLMEAPVENSLLGPTFSCIIAEQFRRLRDADRLFPLNPGVFTEAQVASLQRVTFAHCICATGEDFRTINPNAFLVENGSTAVPCSSIPQLDLSPWQEMAPLRG